MIWICRQSFSPLLLAICLLALPCATPSAQAQTILSGRGAQWQYHNLDTDPGLGWQEPGYNHSAWSSGRAPLGAGDPHIIGNIDIGPAGSRYPTVYFRRNFSVVASGDYEALTLRVLRDDGAAVYLNGTLLMADGVSMPMAHQQYATQIVDGGNETTYFTYSTPAAALRDGVNVLAVAVKQANATSSDLGFDLELEGLLDEEPPALLDIHPSPGTVVVKLDFIRVTFDEPVTGIDREDLLVNGHPADALTFISNREYSFAFASSPSGLVEVSWAPAHGITDDGPRANPFAGGAWTYLVDPDAGDQPHVIISEFLATNSGGIRDEDGQAADWIELQNLGPAGTDLEGWSLTDDPLNPTKWLLPNIHLAAGEFLLVWASGKNRLDFAAPLHTNFQLGADGEYLALLKPDGTVAYEFSPSYPPQQPNVSYGRDQFDPAVNGYFLQPTPGAPNAIAGPGFAEPPSFSLDSGVYASSTLTLALDAAPGTTLHLTFDGSIPTRASPQYLGPIQFSTNLMLKVRAYPSDAAWFPSPVVSRIFILLDSSTQLFTSRLPIVVIGTPGRSIPSDVPPGALRQPGSLLVVDTFRGQSSLQATPNFLGWAGYEIFGQTSSGFPKRPHRIEVEDDARVERDVSLLGMPADGDWRLRNPYSDKCLMNDFLAFELFEAMGHYSVRRRLVEVFVNTTGGRLSYPRDYYGVMLLAENIERASDRVNLARLTPAHTQEPEIAGGYMWKKDKDSQGDLNFNTSGGGGFSGQSLKIHEPKPRDITPVQLSWLRDHLNRMEQSLYATNWLTATGTNHYSHYLDVDSLVDHHWIVEFTKQIDGYRLSNYMQKDRDGKIKMEPIWDWNLAFGNADYLEGGRTNGWYYPLLSPSDHIWLRRLIAGTTSGSGTSGDPDFNQKIADRWSVLRTNALSASRLLARIDALAGELSQAASRDFMRFPRLGSYVWPNPNGAAGGWHVDYVTPSTYQGIISEMKKWVTGRYHWIDSQFTPLPQFNLPQGAISPGVQLQIQTAPGATLYYTLDGSDPRAPGGGVAPGAMAYSGPITITQNVLVFARARRTGSWQNTWSGPALLPLHTQIPPLRITEIMYDPAPFPGDAYDPQDFEFVELKNVGDSSLDLHQVEFTRGIRFSFPPRILNPGECILIVGNRAAFEARYGSAWTIAGEFDGRLDNAGERLTLLGSRAEPIHDFAYDNTWHPIANGSGFSIVNADESAPLASWGLASNWRPSAFLSGSPGIHPVAPRQFPVIVINEILSRPSPSALDAIELYNPGPHPADVSHWLLSDDFRTPHKFTIPTRTIIPPGDFLVYTAQDFGDGSHGVPFGLSSEGEQVWLWSATDTGELTGYLHGFSFGAAPEGITFGRYLNSIGQEHFVTQLAPSLGEANHGPYPSPIVISEIMYHPAPVFTQGSYWNNTEDEYVSLFNRGSQDVSLAHWHLHDGVQFSFPDDLSLSPGQSLIVLAFDPALEPVQLASFQSKFAISPGTLLLGPFTGALDNSGETIALSRAESIASPYVLMDHLHYSNAAPWPLSPAGQGNSLHRVDPEAFGDDPNSWTSAAPRPGVSPRTDSDSDGLPDLWELKFDLDPATPADALEDHDHDGSVNLSEFLAGTHPLNPSSRLGFDRIQLKNEVQLQFTAAPGRTYSVEFQSSLLADQWTQLFTVPARAEHRVETLIDPIPEAGRFYRLLLTGHP